MDDIKARAIIAGWYAKEIKTRGLTLTAAAEATGLTPHQIRSWKTGASEPRPADLVALLREARASTTTMSTIMGARLRMTTNEYRAWCFESLEGER